MDEELESGDLRNDLAAAFSQHAEEAPQAGESAAADRARDGQGRFAPTTAAKDTLPADKEPRAEVEQPQGTEQPQGVPPAPPPPGKVPVGWTKEELQGWEGMSPHHQAAVLRREQEINATLYRTAQERKFAVEVQQSLQPYMQMIQAEGATPAQAIRSVMETAAFLRTATPQDKAVRVAQMIQQFKVPIKELADALDQAPQFDPTPQVMQAVRQELAPVMQMLQQQEQQTLQQAQQGVDAFLGDAQYPYAKQVAPIMGELMESAAARGQQMTLQDAYQRATLLHPEISQRVIDERAQAKVAQLTAAAQKAKSAAVSVASSGAPMASSGEDGDGSLRSDLMSAWRQASGTR